MSEKQRTPIEVKRELKSRMQELKPLLHRGAHGEIGERLGVSQSFVSEVVAGRRWDLNVIEELIKVGTENLNRALKAEKQLDKIQNKKKSDPTN